MAAPKKVEIIVTEGDEVSRVEFWTYDYRIERDPIGKGYAPFSFIAGPAYDVRMWAPQKDHGVNPELPVMMQNGDTVTFKHTVEVPLYDAP